MDLPPLLCPVPTFAKRMALRDHETLYRYEDLLEGSAKVAQALISDTAGLQGACIGLAATAGAEHVQLLWGIWRAGGVVVPLSQAASAMEVAYSVENAEITRVLCSRDQLELMQSRLPSGFATPQTLETLKANLGIPLPRISPDQNATLLYTSGTTSKPKGVPMTHANLLAQVQSLCEAWAWSPEDRIPLFLPLHHVHGLMNVLCCALYAGARVECFDGFNTGAILERVSEKVYTVFMAVPTVYVKLIEQLESLPEKEASRICDGFKAMRLMISGSAALPVSVHRRWQDLTGQILLERYGMTEIGMALSNPYAAKRRPGTVGQPLPGVEIRLMDEAGCVVEAEGVPGEILIRGPGVFAGYLKRPEATAESFTDGWFRSGDIAQWEDGYVRILGRSSIDIIKSGGYKLSALEIETHYLDHPEIREIAVVALPDDTWGESVAAAVVLKAGSALTPDALREWSKAHLSAYKIPRHWRILDQLPRNAMGKVVKPRVTEMFHETA